MKIEKLIIKNYKMFRDAEIQLNPHVNIFVGENDSGKTTILEAVSMVLSGKINGQSIANKLCLDWFNEYARKDYQIAVADKQLILLLIQILLKSILINWKYYHKNVC